MRGKSKNCCRFCAPLEELLDFGVCVLAGDVAASPRQGVEFATTAPALGAKPVVYVPGNHEFLGREIEDSLRDRSSAVIASVRFIGAMLWTDYQLQGNQPSARAMAARGVNDHVRVERPGLQAAIRFTPDALPRHQADGSFIEDALAAPFDGLTVVVTHHAPAPWVGGAPV